MRTFWLLLIITFLLLLSACGSEGATLPPLPTDKQLDHFRLIVPAVVESGYDQFQISIMAENRADEVLLDYQNDWPEAYPFLIVPGLTSFVPEFTGGLMANDWVNGTATLTCYFHRGVFSEQACPVQGYWTLLLEENPVITDNSYTPWVVEIQGRIYW